MELRKCGWKVNAGARKRELEKRSVEGYIVHWRFFFIWIGASLDG